MKRSLLIFLGLTTTAAPALAQEEVEYFEDDFLYEDEPIPTWLATIELGLLLTSGNTEKESLKGRLDATQDLAKWRNTYNLEAFSSNDRDKATAERYRASAKSDYKLLNDGSYLFGRLAGVDDRFSGYSYELTTSLGYGFRAWERSLPYSDDHAFLELEAGPGYRFAKIRSSQLEPGEDNTEEAGIIRVAGRFMYPLSAGARFDQSFSTETSVLGDNNFIAESESALVANLVHSLAMKLAVNLRYLKEPPSGKKSTDTETSVTLIYTL